MSLRICELFFIGVTIIGITSWAQEFDNEIEFDGMSFPKSVFSDNDAMKYLDRFGYMEDMPKNMTMSSPKMKSVLMDFQRFMGLNETGSLDKKTMNMMNMPRCGVADNLWPNTRRVYRMNLKKRFRRYTLQGSVWDKKDITWKVTKYSRNKNLRGKDRDIDRLMKYALDEWSRNSALNFIQEKGDKKPMIQIGFNERDHKDGNPFDGPGRTLAHAFFPQFGGDTHFDDSEQWAIDGRNGVDMLSVAVHEFGHALGLGHSDNKNSLMYPTYAGKRTQLKKDDINGIERLYGKRRERDTSYLDNREKLIPKVESLAPDLCTDFRIDAADCNAMDECFFFRDEYIWRISNDTGIYPGYPKLISDIFPGIPGKVDAVVTDQNSGRTYVFRKSRVWVYKKTMENAVRADDSIENLIRGLTRISHLDAATRWGLNGRIYLFRANKYWRYEPEKVTYPISKRYPQSLKEWRGLPDHIDAAMFWPKTGKTYFFSGSQYYRFNDMTSSVDRADPPFPRDVTKWWLKCKQRSFKNNEIEDKKYSKYMTESNDPSGEGFFKSVASSVTRIASVMRKLLNFYKK